MPSKREVEEYRLLSNEALQKFRIFMAGGKLPRPDRLTQGAFDSLSSELKNRLRQLTPSQKREVALALDAGEDPNESGRQQGDQYDRKTVERLIDAVNGGDLGNDDGEFGQKVLRLLEKTFPNCVGKMSEDHADRDEPPGNILGGSRASTATQKQTGKWRDTENNLGSDDEDDDEEDWSPEGQFKKAHAANDQPPAFPSMPKPGGKLVGMDAASDDYSRRFPETKRIGLDDNYGKQSSVPRSPLDKLAFDEKAGRRINRELDDADDYEKRFPTTFGILG
jgi:hypothetical protein